MNRAFRLEEADYILVLSALEGRGRQAERDAVNRLLEEELHLSATIEHNKDGKPMLPNLNISVSHTQGWAAVMVSEKRNVGIDVEYRNERVNRIANRFLRADEPFKATEERLIAWCAKEALYKLRSELHLGYAEMKVQIAQDSILDMRSGRAYHYSKRVTDEYILVWIAD